MQWDRALFQIAQLDTYTTFFSFLAPLGFYIPALLPLSTHSIFPFFKKSSWFLEYYVLVTSFTRRGLLVSGFNKCILSSVTMVLKRPSRISGTFSGPWEGHRTMEPWSGQCWTALFLLRWEASLYHVGQSLSPWPTPIHIYFIWENSY